MADDLLAAVAAARNVLEAAAGRTLIAPGDLFDVSAFGVLTAAGLANLLHLLRRGDADPAAVERPLALAVSRGATRPGDLWVADIAARTVLAARRAGESAPLVERTLPRFAAVSLLFKLTGVAQAGVAVA